jgi:hypothetical protein
MRVVLILNSQHKPTIFVLITSSGIELMLMRWYSSNLRRYIIIHNILRIVMVYHGPMQNLGDMNRMPLSPLRNNPCATDPCGSAWGQTAMSSPFSGHSIAWVTSRTAGRRVDGSTVTRSLWFLWISVWWSAWDFVTGGMGWGPGVLDSGTGHSGPFRKSDCCA